MVWAARSGPAKFRPCAVNSPANGFPLRGLAGNMILTSNHVGIWRMPVPV
jgi:hypothetical protein